MKLLVSYTGVLKWATRHSVEGSSGFHIYLQN